MVWSAFGAGGILKGCFWHQGVPNVLLARYSWLFLVGFSLLHPLDLAFILGGLEVSSQPHR